MDHENIINQIIAKCWVDEAFKQSLIENPKKILGEFGFIISDSVTVKVIEDSPEEKTFVIPAKPDEGELGDILEGRKAAWQCGGAPSPGC